MKKMYAGLVGLTAMSAFALSAEAADIYRGGLKDGPAYVAVTTWNGFYGGFNAGYGWAADDNWALVSPDGGFGGGQIGYNWQGVLGLGPQWVLGVEADFQGSGISGSASVPGLHAESSLNWFGTVRGRAGYAFDRTLLYVTGGLAFGEVEGTVNALNLTDTQTGYVIGAGVEHKFNPSWSVKGEYQFLSLDANDTVGALGIGLSDRTEVHTLRVGLNYHLAQGFGPLN
jgi:outer membrane immunogenic protein